jgi:hypothetical protein
MNKKEQDIINKYIFKILQFNKEYINYSYQIHLKDFVLLGIELKIFNNKEIIFNFINEYIKKIEYIYNDLGKIDNNLKEISKSISGAEAEPYFKEIIFILKQHTNGEFADIGFYDYANITILEISFHKLKELYIKKESKESKQKQFSILKEELERLSLCIKNSKVILEENNILKKNNIKKNRYYNNELLFFNDSQDLINCMQDIQTEIGVTTPQKETTPQTQQKGNNNFILVTSINTPTPIQQSKFATDETIRQYFIGTVEAWENLFNSKDIQPATEENGLQITCIQKNYIHTLLNYLMEKQVFKKIKQGINYYKQLEDLNIFYYNNKKLTDIRKQAQPKKYKEIETVIKDIIKL